MIHYWYYLWRLFALLTFHPWDAGSWRWRAYVWLGAKSMREEQQMWHGRGRSQSGETESQTQTEGAR